jgi:hypothetical protein
MEKDADWSGEEGVVEDGCEGWGAGSGSRDDTFESIEITELPSWAEVRIQRAISPSPMSSQA